MFIYKIHIFFIIAKECNVVEAKRHLTASQEICCRIANLSMPYTMLLLKFIYSKIYSYLISMHYPVSFNMRRWDPRTHENIGCIHQVKDSGKFLLNRSIKSAGNRALHSLMCIFCLLFFSGWSQGFNSQWETTISKIKSWAPHISREIVSSVFTQNEPL